MTKFFLFFLLFLTFCVTSPVYAAAPPSEKILLFRKILVKECTSQGKCLDVVSEQSSPAKVEIRIAKVKKGGVVSFHGEDHLRVEAKGTPFQADLFVNMVGTKASVYAVLRSGKGTKRHGVTKKFLLSDAESTPVNVTDQSITIDGKLYRAELIIGAAENSPSSEKSVSLGIRFSRGGETVCEMRKEVKNSEDTFFCEGMAIGNPAVVRARATIVPPTAEQRKLGANLDQVYVTAYAVEKTPNGPPIESRPEIVALDNEKAVMEISTTPSTDSMRMEVTPYVIW